MNPSLPGMPVAQSTDAPSHVEPQDTASTSYEVLVVVQPLVDGDLRVAFILEPNPAASIGRAFDAIVRYYRAHPECTSALEVVEGQPATWAASQGVEHADIVFMDESAYGTYGDVIDAGLDLLDQDKEEQAKLQARLARLSAPTAADPHAVPRGLPANVTTRRPRADAAASLLGGFGNVTASVGGGHGTGIPLQVETNAQGAIATGRDDVSAISAAAASAAVGRRSHAAFTARPAFQGGSAPMQRRQLSAIQGGSAPLPRRQLQPASAQPAGGAASAPPLRPAPTPGGVGGGGGGGGGGSGGSSSGSGGSGSTSVTSPASHDVDKVIKISNSVQKAFATFKQITSEEHLLAWISQYKLQCSMYDMMGEDISIHTMVGDDTVFKSTAENKVWGAMWFSILSSLCSTRSNPLASRIDRMINNGEQGAEALTELQRHYLGESTKLRSLKQLDNLLFMTFEKGQQRIQFVIKMTDLMDSLQLQIPSLEFSQIIRVFLCLRALDRPFVKKLREVLVLTKEKIEDLDIDRLKALINQQESLGLDFNSPDPQSPSSNHADSGGDGPAKDWAAGVAILSQCPQAEKEEKLKLSLKGNAPCLICFPSSSTKPKDAKHAAAQCPLLRTLGYTVVGCDGRGRPNNTMARVKEIDTLKKENESLKAQLKAAKAASANKATKENEPEEETPLSGFSAAAEAVVEDKKWSEVVTSSQGDSAFDSAFEELDLE